METKISLGTFLAALLLLLSARGAAQQPASNLPDEYLKNLRNYEFLNTRGMKDLAPNRHSWLPSQFDDADNWELPTDAELVKLKELGISFPDFSFITGIDTVAPGQKRQRTHTVEHILYALPGDALSLYPYYGLEEMQIHRNQTQTDIESTKGFLETFSHWYDYRNGGRVVHVGSDGKRYDLLDFPSCRNYIQMSDDYGFYGGIYMSPGTTGYRTYSVGSVQEYIDAVNAINNAGGKGSIELTADLDFTGYNDVPMLGDRDGNHFAGVFNGNGHKISNLKIEKNDSDVGLIRFAADGAMVCNLVIDYSCSFQGTYRIGMIAKFDGGGLIVRNVVMNGTVKGTRSEGDHCTGAILGNCDNNDTDNHLTFENLYIGGNIGNPDMGAKNNTVLCGWFATDSNHTDSEFTNIVFTGNLYGAEDLALAKYIRRYTHVNFNQADCYTDGDTYVEKHFHYSIRYTNCYGEGTANDREPAWKPISDYTTFDGWIDATTPPVESLAGANLGAELLNNSGHRPWHGDSKIENEDQKRRKAGTSAVFYFPENGNLANEFLNDRTEYVIAADFSQTFEPDTHLDIDAMTVKEPLVAFRHIFRIRDGRQQERELRENNRDYIRRHQHKVSARVGANFQIRLDFPLPINWGKSGGVTNYYYKNAAGEYHRVKQFMLRVLDGDTRAFKYDLGDGLPNNDDRFELGANIRMRRAQHAANKEYAEAIEGMFDYHTMLIKPRVSEEAHYIVQVIAKDDDGKVIVASDGDMVLMEYDITFLPEKGASLLTEDELYSADNKFRHARDEYMKDKYGEPEDKIDFDNYFAINKLEDDDELKKKMISYSVIQHTDANGLYKDFPVWLRYSDFQGQNGVRFHSFYKWPLTWARSGYSFGYNYRYDYNMYMLTTHSENVPYHAKADKWNSNLDGDGNGLYDRLYYKTKRMNAADPRVNVEQGYYYYVNAASDPGVSARLNFNITCPGSRVIVSAWVAELSPADAFWDEPANLSFNFVAVMKETNERITLHNFVTGYLGEKDIYDGSLKEGDQLGKWLNVYYSFVPRLAEFDSKTLTFDDVHHFELELAHNGRSSAGSDYAIDDIRAYVVPPSSDADHDGYACEDTPLDVNIETSFETLLEKSGEAETFEGEEAEEMTLYFALVDKEMVDENGDLQKAYLEAVMQDSKVVPYGKVTFSNNYRANDRYQDVEQSGNVAYNKGYRFTDANGDRMIKFRTTLADGTFRLGKEYYVVFRSVLSGGDGPSEEDLDSFFDIANTCSYNCVMTVRPPLFIKIDGVKQEDLNDISVCENQSPVIQGNVWSTDNTPVEIQKNAYFDWFDGSINDFVNYRFTNYPESMETAEDDFEDAGAKTLKRALEVFRLRYSEAETVAGIKTETEKGDDGEMLEQWMLDIIYTASSPDASGRTRLQLHQPSFVLPPLDLPDGVEKAKAKVVAIPIVDLYPAGGYEKVCPSPVEVGVKIANRTPVLMHGLTSIDYPENLVDVPLRVGINQLRKGMGTTLDFSKKTIDMPVRLAASSDGKEKVFSRVEEKVLIDGNEETRTGCILLAQTNDPEYRDLGTVNVTKDESGKDTKEETGYLLWVGEISELVATAQAEGSDNSTASRQYFHADFDKDFRFKEGYFYRFRFSFQEPAEIKVDANAAVVCKGQDVFTIKVVPEYMQWTGDLNLSWDNDDNWRRVSADEIFKTKEGDHALFTDGASNNHRGYAPLPFTKTIVDKPAVDENDVLTGENPWLYAPTASKEVTDEYDPSKTNIWTSNPLCAAPTEEMKAVGNPTPLIQYDMTGYVGSGNGSEELRCRTWYGNVCEQIHFKPGGTIMNQHKLEYEKAWVDIELDHSRWYTLSTPLQEVYAGDFYLPSKGNTEGRKGARQETELFQPINFDNSLEMNHRFKPAVYQRGWDKSEAKVYDFGKTDVRNVIVESFWSHVYNDVDEQYGGGVGFSIKTDISRLAESDKPEKVMFRLPKADSNYKYFTQDGETDRSKDITSRMNGTDNSHRLNPESGTIKAETKTDGNWFLVGNPFMTHMDIKEFLKKNIDKLEQKFWIVTEKGQIAGSMTDGGAFVADPTGEDDDDYMADPTALAPMQGFFVKTIEKAKSVELTYNESMMRRHDAVGKCLTGMTRSDNETRPFRISAFNGGQPSSACVVIASEGGGYVDVEAFHNSGLGVNSTVYTVKDHRALSISSCPDMEGMEVGVMADAETETTLRFDGTDNVEGMMLLDTTDGSLTTIYDGMELTVRGEVSGRFYLTSGIEDLPAASGIVIDAESGMLRVVDRAATGTLLVDVFDTLGRRVASAATDTDSVEMPLAKGVYVVEAVTGRERQTVKIRF